MQRIAKANVSGYVNYKGWECSFVVNGHYTGNVVIKGNYRGEDKEYNLISSVEHLRYFPKDVLDKINAEVQSCREKSQEIYRQLHIKSEEDYERDILPKINALLEAFGDRWEFVYGDEFEPYLYDHETGNEIYVEV